MSPVESNCLFFFFNDTATTEIYTSFPTRRSSDLEIQTSSYSALSELHDLCARLPGATRLTLFGAHMTRRLALRLRLLTDQSRSHELCKRRDQFLDVWHADARNHVVAGSSRERSVAS